MRAADDVVAEDAGVRPLEGTVMSGDGLDCAFSEGIGAERAFSGGAGVVPVECAL